ncbi:IS4 family transposase [Mycobacterium ostraviense]|nr:IS4 family transposase [Mycobacterium ostraviense]KZS64663.1 transposase [Mycobacterium ostraviense]UGT91039.1 IS4 family transposase [Mycobacterium ostraviense]UGT92412.1 IS4 family transposase [Mycobacterium ostraviense]
MPRAGWVKPESDQRLSDHISLGVLTRVFPPEVIDEVLAECGRVEVRHRLLPARVVVYYVLGLALFSTSSYEEVMRMLVAGLSWASGWSREWSVPTKAALFQARKRLGSEPLRALFDKAVVPLTDPQVAGGFYRSWRLMSMDGLCLDAADTEANVARFGRPASSRGEGRGGAFPQVRVLGLAECGSHAIIDVAVGSYRQGEQTLAEQVLRSLLPGMLLLADRGFFSYPLWTKARGTGADLLWRMKSNAVLPVEKRYSDGSFASRIYPGTKARRNDTEGIDVRVVEYTLAPVDTDTGAGLDTADRTYRLATTLTDPAAAPAAELAQLYTQRWEIETAFDELKTHQRGPGLVLRSKMPDGVIQEVYGYLCVHYAIRWLMYSAATDYGHDPDRVSFIRSLRAARRTTASHPGFSP